MKSRLPFYSSDFRKAKQLSHVRPICEAEAKSFSLRNLHAGAQTSLGIRMQVSTIDTPLPRLPDEAAIAYGMPGPSREQETTSISSPAAKRHISALPSSNETRPHKRLKSDDQTRIDQLRHEIEQLKKKLAFMQTTPSNDVQVLGKACLVLRQEVEYMRRKLQQHSYWKYRINRLMETAPLLDVATCAQKTKQPSQQLSMHSVPPNDSDVVVNKCIDATVITSQQNASDLLQSATMNGPWFSFPLTFESRGWQVGTGTLLTGELGFRCHRRIAAESTEKVKQVAMTMWNSIQHHNVFHTFVPIVQDSAISHQKNDRSLSCRSVQISAEYPAQTVATVESILSTDTSGEDVWQISLESIHDLNMCSVVAESIGDCVAPPSTSPVKLDLGLQMSKLSMHNTFVLGARISETEGGADILMAGSGRFGHPQLCDPAFDLLQHLVSDLPAYEDIHLAPLREICKVTAVP